MNLGPRHSSAGGRNRRLHGHIERLEPRLPFAADLQAISAYISMDTNGDGLIAPQDALRVINYLNSRAFPGAGEPTNDAGASERSMVNVNQDPDVTPLDALLVINQLNKDGPTTLDVERFWSEETASMSEDQAQYSQIVFERLNRLREDESVTARNVVELVDTWMPLIQESELKRDDFEGPWLSQGYDVPISEQNPEEIPLGWTPFGELGDQEQIGKTVKELWDKGSQIYDAITEGLTWTKAWSLALDVLTDPSQTGVSGGNNWDEYYTPSGGFTPAFFESGWGQIQDATGYDPFGNSGKQTIIYDEDAPLDPNSCRANPANCT